MYSNNIQNKPLTNQLVEDYMYTFPLVYNLQGYKFG